MNIVRATLERIFGEQMPVGATNFHTGSGLAFFLVGLTGEWVSVEMTQEQIAELKERRLFGSFGWALQ